MMTVMNLCFFVATFPFISKQSTGDILVFTGTNITLSLTCEAYPYPTFNWIKGSETLTLQQSKSLLL